MNGFHNNQLNIPLTNEFFQIYKIIYQYLKHFPKKERYTLGEKIETLFLETIQEIFHLNQLPDPLKEKSLLKLNAKNETLKLLIRLAHEIKVLDIKQYLNIQEKLQKTGKMIGGWIKYLKSKR